MGNEISSDDGAVEKSERKERLGLERRWNPEVIGTRDSKIPKKFGQTEL
jgi:hypothetical protein